jgi:ATP-binding cassette subfamily B protein
VLHQEGRLSVGDVYLVYAYASAISTPLQAIVRQLQLLQSAGAALSRIQALLEERPRVRWSTEATLMPPSAPPLELEGVTFSYPGEPPTLKDVTLRLSAGRTLGVAGRTGSGKTTLIRLLLRFQDPDRGAVRIGGVDLRRVAREDLRRRVGLVSQEAQLLHGTVRDNLTLFDGQVSDGRLVHALTEVGLGEWLASLPAGLDTPLAPGGRDLSAGQSQLLAAARVFLRDPAVVVLDEASSRVDAATEERLHAAFGRLFSGRTGVVVAHRLSTLREVDDIVVLDRGRIVEAAPRDELVANRGSRFAQLLEASVS